MLQLILPKNTSYGAILFDEEIQEMKLYHNGYFESELYLEKKGWWEDRWDIYLSVVRKNCWICKEHCNLSHMSLNIKHGGFCD